MKVCKVIKPKRLNEPAMKKEIYNGMARFGRHGIKEFDKTVDTWEKEKPTFIYRVALHGTSHARAGPGPAVDIQLTGDELGVQKWNWLDLGTEPHEIWAGYYTGKSDSKSLAFSSSFKPKTPVGSVFPGAGGEGKIDTFVLYVEHPGITPRHLRDKLCVILTPVFKREMEESMRRAAKASGHGKR